MFHQFLKHPHPVGMTSSRCCNASSVPKSALISDLGWDICWRLRAPQRQVVRAFAPRGATPLRAARRRAAAAAGRSGEQCTGSTQLQSSLTDRSGPTLPTATSLGLAGPRACFVRSVCTHTRGLKIVPYTRAYMYTLLYKLKAYVRLILQRSREPGRSLDGRTQIPVECSRLPSIKTLSLGSEVRLYALETAARPAQAPGPHGQTGRRAAPDRSFSSNVEDKSKKKACYEGAGRGARIAQP